MRKNIIFIMILQLLISGLNSEKTLSKCKDSFNIYLVRNSNIIHKVNKPDLKDFVLEDIPLLTLDSISSYIWHSHLISFSNNVKKVLNKRGFLIDRLFVVVVNDERIYWGRFTDLADSYISNSPAIFLEMGMYRGGIPVSIAIHKNLIINQDSVDVRNDIRIYNVLKASGKLLP
jgi:hypothetical protein